MVNLSLEILLHLLSNDGRGRAGQGVKLSVFRKKYGIPPTTFHRHLKTLLKTGIVVRIGRDNYAISLAFLGRCRDRYMELMQEEIPF